MKVLSVLNGNQHLVSTNRSGAITEPGGWLAQRDRKGVVPGASIWDSAVSKVGAVTGDVTRNLTTENLWGIYWRTPDVRASVDSIVRRVATTDWSVVPRKGSIDVDDQDELKAATEAAREASRWLRNPVVGKTWQQMMTMFTTDLLVYDAGVLEKAKTGDTLDELVPRRGDDFWPVTDKAGTVEGYVQEVNGSTVKFETDELVYVNLYCNTTTPRGMPIIESLLSEVISALRGSERLMSTLDIGEIPPGFLYLTGIAGKAAEDVINSFVNDAGKDHKMRVLHFPSKASGSADWVHMGYTPKELQLESLLTKVTRTIWRLFGVFPVEMGATDGMPRATAQVQLDASASHLLRPILELVQEVFTAQVLPLLIDEKWLGILEFKFDFTRDLTPAEQKTVAEADKIRVDQGLNSRNEIRVQRGEVPLGEEGDVITTSAQIFRLDASVLIPPPDESDPGEGGSELDPDDGTGSGSGTDIGAAPGEDDDEGEGSGVEDEGEAPGEEEGLALIKRGYESSCGPGCTYDHRAPGRAEDLPSDWQPASRFSGFRTLDLSKLAMEVSRYQRTVEPLWKDAEKEFLSLLSTAYRDEELTSEEAAKLTGDLSRILTRLAQSWELETADQYQETGKIGTDAAEKITGLDTLSDSSTRADIFQAQAMGYLVGDDGPLENIRRNMIALLGAVSRSRVLAARASGITIPDGVEPGMSFEAFFASATHVFQRNEYRIGNWAGKLVELGNDISTEGIQDASTVAGEEGAVVWFVEWVNVGDGVMCQTCSDLGQQGYIRLSNLPTRPGGATECRGNCRCVLVFWTGAEVANNTATLLGGGNTGEAL